ncbi:hypothetical protein EDD18DRAFT_850636 [Armillaria luteobubalina]|uniref:Uncharacterized protein n=1 Tax=Armillaria luteobubalina TaxID=153913 RepID=A0AA39QCW8_9AGAR|nr:hypothetical protein EDD18DRAFT_850636 [Armillaria luteobubalina]
MARSSALSLALALRLTLLHLLIYSTTGSGLPCGTRKIDSTDSPLEKPVFNDDGSRTVLSILWSSLATIFACIWVSVHPNVPGPKMEKKGWLYLTFLRRAELMILTVTSPEFVTIWALRQHSVARLIRALCPETLTMSHGFLVSMGGFVYSDGCPITLDNLQHDTRLVVWLGQIKKKEISDRSKGDGLSKGVAIGQSTWFLLQCVARVTQHLPLTILEIVAVGYAFFTIVNYAVWWHKPLEISVPFQVPIPSQPMHTTPFPYVSLTQPRNTTALCTSEAPPRPLPGHFPRSMDIEHLKDWVNFRLLSLFFGGDIIPGVDGPSSEEGVPRMWAGHPNNRRLFLLVALGNCMGIFFGVIYCASWNYEFITSIERILWRVCSVIFAVAPPSAILVTLVTEKTAAKLGFDQPGQDNHLFSFMYRSIYIFLWVIYDMARVFSLTEPYLALRDLPAGVSQGIEWANFLPHI